MHATRAMQLTWPQQTPWQRCAAQMHLFSALHTVDLYPRCHTAREYSDKQQQASQNLFIYPSLRCRSMPLVFMI